MIEKTIGLKAIIRVNGFDDARDWLYLLIRAGVAQCAACNKPATHVFWQDQAEWYCFCEEHRETGDQWTGSTRWNPHSFSKIVIPGKAQEWVKTLKPQDRKLIKLREFDATDYYALLGEDHWKDDGTRVLLAGSETVGRRVIAYQIPECNQWVYEIEHYSPGYVSTQSLTGIFDSVEACIEHAKQASE